MADGGRGTAGGGAGERVDSDAEVEQQRQASQQANRATFLSEWRIGQSRFWEGLSDGPILTVGQTELPFFDWPGAFLNNPLFELCGAVSVSPRIQLNEATGENRFSRADSAIEAWEKRKIQQSLRTLRARYDEPLAFFKKNSQSKNSPSQNEGERAAQMLVLDQAFEEEEDSPSPVPSTPSPEAKNRKTVVATEGRGSATSTALPGPSVATTISCFALVVSPAEIPTMRAMSKGIAPHCDDFRFFVAGGDPGTTHFASNPVHDLSAIGADSIPPDRWDDPGEPNFFQKWAMAILHAYEEVFAVPGVDEELEMVAAALGTATREQNGDTIPVGQLEELHEIVVGKLLSYSVGGDFSDGSSSDGGGSSEKGSKIFDGSSNTSTTGPATANKAHTTNIPAWYCMLESDVYFLPENFRRFSLLRGADPFREAVFFAHVWLFSNIVAGVEKEHSYGSCFSRRGFVRFAQMLGRVRDAERERYAKTSGETVAQKNPSSPGGIATSEQEQSNIRAATSEPDSDEAPPRASSEPPRNPPTTVPSAANSPFLRSDYTPQPLPQSRLSFFGTREIGQRNRQFECLPFRPHVWAEANNMLHYCLRESGVTESSLSESLFISPSPSTTSSDGGADDVVDVDGRYYWAQAWEEALTLAPPGVSGEVGDFTLLARKKRDGLRGMWLGRLARNRICAGERSRKNSLRNFVSLSDKWGEKVLDRELRERHGDGDVPVAYAEFPISFHGHRGEGVKTNERNIGGKVERKVQKLSMECVDWLVRGAAGTSLSDVGRVDVRPDGDGQEKVVSTRAGPPPISAGSVRKRGKISAGSVRAESNVRKATPLEDFEEESFHSTALHSLVEEGLFPTAPLVEEHHQGRSGELSSTTTTTTTNGAVDHEGVGGGETDSSEDGMQSSPSPCPAEMEERIAEITKIYRARVWDWSL